MIHIFGKLKMKINLWNSTINLATNGLKLQNTFQIRISIY